MRARAGCACTAARLQAARSVGQHTPAAFPLTAGEVHVWWLHPEQCTPQQLHHCHRLLPPHDQQYVTAATDPAVRQQRLLARTLLRQTLARYACTPPQQLQFGRGEHGKPHLLAHSAAGDKHGIAPRLQFNLSHTRSLLACAVALDVAVGVDVELAERRLARDCLKLAARRFTPAEVADLQAVHDPAARQQLFVSLWTLKEALVKARGSGISAPPGLKGFSIGWQPSPPADAGLMDGAPRPCRPARLHITHHAPEQQECSLLLCRPTQQHYAALCIILPQPPAACSQASSRSRFGVSVQQATGGGMVTAAPAAGVQVLAASDHWADVASLPAGEQQLGSGLVRMRSFEAVLGA